MIETMGKEGLIGPSDGIKPRADYNPRRKGVATAGILS
jgi:hypothetical protein